MALTEFDQVFGPSAGRDHHPRKEYEEIGLHTAIARSAGSSIRRPEEREAVGRKNPTCVTLSRGASPAVGLPHRRFTLQQVGHAVVVEADATGVAEHLSVRGDPRQDLLA
jgi:hypothetical protein